MDNIKLPDSIKLPINGAELRFFEPTAANARVLAGVVSANLEHLAPWRGAIARAVSEGAALVYLENLSKNRRAGKAFFYGIFVDGAFCGEAELKEIDHAHKTCELGYWLSKDATKRGLASASVRELEKLAFGALSLNRAMIRCDIENAPSLKLPRRLGYVEEGVLRELLVNNNHPNPFRSLLYFSKLKSEYEAE